MLIRKNDTVIVLSGRDAGQQGRVLEVDRKNNRVIVEGVNRVLKHVKRSSRNHQGGR
ncbi:MAG: 50S ribosomal protein L24, partial [Pirellulaceae bacterium]